MVATLRPARIGVKRAARGYTCAHPMSVSGAAVPTTSALERVLRRDRLLIVAALVALTALSWLQLVAGAAVLISAAAFQLSPAKGAGLSQCRAPVGYFITEWREGRAGAVLMGLRHGSFCIGCCWMLMAVLFAVGIMNVVWGAVLTAFVVAE